MTDGRIELLAPAGDFSCFMAAINSGADAVYLGGSKFGARAYAGNFTDAELLEALNIAHLFGKKIYLTVNTLVKSTELDELVPYIEPLYQTGLDGVIVQDIGVLSLLHRHFPDLKLHASTQMTVTGAYGAAFLKNMGVCRIVPARELSLDEIKELKEQTGLEIECFIHGAMCYSYSGQCLLSSLIGGRSGNRGRCAGPCRLPYTDENGKTSYPLSLKDMYTLPLIPQLIEAGIDSFKIEGRMKSPEYVAGVTSIYRKYIDKYLAEPYKKYSVDKTDEELIRGLYIRKDICSGYYKQHNSKAMLTMSEAGYLGSSDEVLNSIRRKYLDKKPLLDVKGHTVVYVGKPVGFTLSYKDISVSVEGGPASLAQNRPLLKKEIAERFSKLGDTYFNMEDITVDADENVFVPVKAMNELRRLACDKLAAAIISKNSPKSDTPDNTFDFDKKSCNFQANNGTALLAVSVSTAQQLKAVSDFRGISRLYVNADILCADKKLCEYMTHLKKTGNMRLYLSLPYILRKRSYKFLPEYQRLLEAGSFDGVLVRNLEELQWLISIDYSGQTILDHTVYVWNTEADSVLKAYADYITVPLELNRRELSALGEQSRHEMLIYGYMPLMYSANCIRKTVDRCTGNEKLSDSPEAYRLTDRYGNVFQVVQQCRHCYNILYNTVPLSLYGQLENIKSMGFGALRLDFTVENAYEAKKILECYINGKELPIKDFTNGHFKRGVE